MPQMPGKGNQTSLLGVTTGYMLNAKSKHPQEAMTFLKFMNSPEITRKYYNMGNLMAIKGGMPESKIHPLTIRFSDLLNNTSTIVAPPDTGYNLKVSDAFYETLTQVLGGVTTSEDAIKRLDERVAKIKK